MLYINQNICAMSYGALRGQMRSEASLTTWWENMANSPVMIWIVSLISGLFPLPDFYFETTMVLFLFRLRILPPFATSYLLKGDNQTHF